MNTKVRLKKELLTARIDRFIKNSNEHDGIEGNSVCGNGMW